MRGLSDWFPPLPASCLQVRHLHGEEDWRPGVRAAGGPGGGQTQDGDDGVCLPHGTRHEESLETPAASARAQFLQRHLCLHFHINGTSCLRSVSPDNQIK